MIHLAKAAEPPESSPPVAYRRRRPCSGSHAGYPKARKQCFQTADLSSNKTAFVATYTCCVPTLKSLWVQTTGRMVRIGRISNAPPIARKFTRSTVTYH